jgi:hypothetical protein
MISVEGCPDESSGGLGRVFLSSNSGRLASLVTYLGAGVHGGRRRTQPLLLKCDCGKGKRKDFLSKCRRSLDQNLERLRTRDHSRSRRSGARRPHLTPLTITLRHEHNGYFDRALYSDAM